jgi:hypothetical protein
MQYDLLRIRKYRKKKANRNGGKRIQIKFPAQFQYEL